MVSISVQQDQSLYKQHQVPDCLHDRVLEGMRSRDLLA